jgi:hypothetical protein
MKVHICRSKAVDKKYCFVSRHVSPLKSPISRGGELVPVMQEFGVERIDLELDEDRGALELPDLLGNGLNYLVMRSHVAETIGREFALGPHETAPIALINKKKRVHSSDYVVVNPHGRVECLDLERSQMDKNDPEFVRLLGKYSLLESAIPVDRDIFRVKGLAAGYLFSGRLVDFIRAQQYTNFQFDDVPVS